ncbi:MATE family efflux transporter, partial [[Clostridium] scindens]
FQCVFFGLGNACAVMIGNELGRNHTKLAYAYGRIFIGINIGFCLVMTAALLLLKGTIIAVYKYDAVTSQMLNLT